MQKVLDFSKRRPPSLCSLVDPSQALTPSSEFDSRPDMDSTSATAADAQEEAACLYAMQLVSFSVLPMALKAAIELGVLETIASAGSYLSSSEIVARLPAAMSNPEASVMLDRILRLLASYSILTCSLSPVGERSYSGAPVIKYLTPNVDGLSLAGLALVNQDKVLMESWYHLKDVVLEGGIPFDKAHGMTSHEYYGTDPRFKKVLNEGVMGHSCIFTNKLLEIYEGFIGLDSLVDVGGGLGSTIAKITAKYPGISGINFDLPQVILEAPPLHGVEHVSGDMFESVPSADAIFMKFILHCWSDDQCSKLLKNCWKALPKNGKVIVAEYILSLELESNVAAQAIYHLDLNMLAHITGGKERTEKEFESLAKQVGFSGIKVIYIFSGFWVMEFIK